MRLKLEFDGRFQERAVNLAALPDLIEHSRRQVAIARRLYAQDPTGDNPGILGRELGRLGDALRVADDPEAGAVLTEVLALWGQLGKERPAYLVELKIADVDERTGNSEAALQRLDRLVVASGDERFALYRDFALHARGALHFRASSWEAARADIVAALALRRAQGRGRLISATEALLVALESRASG